VIVEVPSLIAIRPPSASVAVLYGLGVVRCRHELWILPRRRIEPPADESEIGREVLDPKRLNRRMLVRRYDVEQLRNGALDETDLLGVEYELKDGAAASLLRKLGIDDLIRPCPKVAGGLDPSEYVGSTEPTAISKGGLQNNARARAHRIQRAKDRVFVTVLSEIDNCQTFGAKRMSVAALVLEPSLPENLQNRIDPCGSVALTKHNRQVQGGPVPASQELREVRSRQLDRRT
jgi:hypothetical protein